MPRYIPIETVTFTDANGNQYPVKIRRPIESRPVRLTVAIKKGDFLDEIASRVEVFGEYSEYRSYELVDANIVELKEARFDVSKIRKIKVPV